MDALDGNAIALFCKCRCIAGEFEALAHDPVQDQLAFHELRARQRALVGLRVEQIGWEVHLMMRVRWASLTSWKKRALAPFKRWWTFPSCSIMKRQDKS